VTGGLWKLPELWTPKTAPTAPWKTTEQVFHSSHRPSSSFLSDPETESANLSTKPGQPQHQSCEDDQFCIDRLGGEYACVSHLCRWVYGCGYY
jgi:hypothetical protein